MHALAAHRHGIGHARYQGTQYKRKAVRRLGVCEAEPHEVALDRIAELEDDKARVKKQIEALQSEAHALQSRIDTLHSMLDEPLRRDSSSTQLAVGLIADLASAAKDGLETALGTVSDASVQLQGHAMAGPGINAEWASAADIAVTGDAATLVMGFAALFPSDIGTFSKDRPSIVWGLAEDARSAWQEPPAGWSTVPDASFDVARGAWGTRCEPVPSSRYDASRGVMFKAVISLPYRGSVARAGALAFKFQVGDLWFGHGLKGANLHVKAPSPPAGFITDKSDSTDEEEQNGSRKSSSKDKGRSKNEEDTANLLAGLSAEDTERLQSLRAAKAAWEAPIGSVGLDASLNPTRSLDAPLPWKADQARDTISAVTDSEDKARRSLMHRYDIAHSLFSDISLPNGVSAAANAARAASLRISSGVGASAEAPDRGLLDHASSTEARLAAVALWLRFSAARLLTWNHNYNVKPREISRAQTALTKTLSSMWTDHPWARRTLEVALCGVGRGGDGDMGQRIRDEILAIQSANGCKGGMMEQWHQKLHNNSSPDDIEICRALLAYIDSGLDIQAYWSTLHAAGIDAARLASYDRSITHEPEFKQEQCEGLKRDLEAYLVTLCAVHGGQDLHAAALAAVGYTQASCKGKAISHDGVPGFKTPRFLEVMQALLLKAHASEASNGAKAGSSDPLAELERKLGLLMEARLHCHEFLTQNSDLSDVHARDVIYLDVALSGTFRNIMEAGLDLVTAATSELVKEESSQALHDKRASLANVVHVLAHAAQQAAIGSEDNSHTAPCSQDLHTAAAALKDSSTDAAEALWAAHLAHAALLRINETVPAGATRWLQALRAIGEPLASSLGIEAHAAEQALEDTVRADPGALLAQLAELTQPMLQRVLGLSEWTVIAAGFSQSRSAQGVLRLAPSIAEFQGVSLGEATVLLVDKVDPDHDLPQGCVALISRSTINALSHFALRARAGGAVVATCSDAATLEPIAGLAGGLVQVQAGSTEVQVKQADEAHSGSGHAAAAPAAQDLSAAADAVNALNSQSDDNLQGGRWVLPEGEYAESVVGPKAINAQLTRQRLPSSVATPPSFALPFQALPATIHNECNSSGHADNAEAVKHLNLPDALSAALSDALNQLSAKLSSSADSNGGGLQADSALPHLWRAITHVWASKWGDRAHRACALLQLPIHAARMSVLVQPLVDADMAFVSHTRDPRASADASAGRMYVEAVFGLGESLVGNSAGCALAFTVAPDRLRAALSSVPGANDLKLSCLSEGDGGDSAEGESVNLGHWLRDADAEVIRSAAAESLAVVSVSSKPWIVQPVAGDAEFAPVIARSASNLEDLPGFSGAGVFDSVPVCGSEHAATGSSLDYLSMARRMLSMAIATMEVQSCFDDDQDIEGVLDKDGRMFLVQVRPQV